jgi:lysophospholipase L1-like esterase
MVILGASVAYGAYSSKEETAYFAQLQKILEERGVPVDITVIAAGAWKSEQSLQALTRSFDTIKPEAILFINGLNSLTVGATAYARYSERTETRDGSEWSLIYHERDYEDRVRVYTQNMARAKDFARSKGVPVFFALQPALFEKKPQTDLEKQIAALYEQNLGPREMLIESYSKMRSAMNALVGSGAYFLDLSRAFNGETATTFADMWHFSDPGHRIVAERLADFLGETIKIKSKSVQP